MSSAQHQPKTRILVVEDNRIDALLIGQALRQTDDWPSTVDVVDDGDKAIKFLGRQQAYAEAAPPDLVILDFNLPKRNGAEVLQFVRGNEQLRDLLVFVLSSAPADVSEEAMHEAQVKANGYFEKPHGANTYLSVIESIKESYRSAAGTRRSATA